MKKAIIILLALSSLGCSKVSFSAYKAEAVTPLTVPPGVVDNFSEGSAFEISSSGKMSESSEAIIQSTLGSFSPAPSSHNNFEAKVSTGFSEAIGEIFY